MPETMGWLRSLGIAALRDGGSAAPNLRAQLRSATLMEQVADRDQARPQFTFDVLAMRHGLDLARAGELTRSPRERRRNPGLLPEIAEAYADLAERPDLDETSQLDLHALAASTWSLGGYQANAAVVARRYLHRIDRRAVTDPVEFGPRYASPQTIAAVVGLVCSRDVQELAQIARFGQEAMPALAERLSREYEEDVADLADFAMLGAYGLVIRALSGLTTFWLRGDRPAGVSAVADLRRAADVVLEANIVDTWTLLDNLAFVVEDLVATSPWRLLRQASTWDDLWYRYVRELAHQPIPVLQVWTSQRRALDAGLLAASMPNLMISMPTSAGKTSIAEWAILHALQQRLPIGTPDALVVYLVPSRALAAEVERRLTKALRPCGIRVSRLFGGAEHVQFELQLIATTDILVATPEKLDLLIRNDPSVIPRLRLVLTDEGHLLGEGNRGTRLELLLTRIRRQAPQSRYLVLSAVLPNASDIAVWLEPGGANRNLVEESWSPSRLRVGLFHWQGRKTDGQRGMIDYAGDQPGTSFFVPYVLTRTLRRTALFPLNKSDVVSALALHFHNLGPVLVVASRRDWAEGAAKNILKTALKAEFHIGGNTGDVVDDDTQGRRDRLAGYVGRIVGSSHELVTLVRAGIAYHHAEVPQAVRQVLETAYRERTLYILCATSTLAQGVNLPAKTVLIHSTVRGQRGVDRLSVREFWNTAGRAGRAGIDSEGHVVLVANSGAEQTQLRRYLRKSNIEPVTSAIAALYQNLLRYRLGRPASPGDDTTNLELSEWDSAELQVALETLDWQLLECLTEEVIDSNDEQLLVNALAEVLATTLSAIQCAPLGISMTSLARHTARRLRRLAETVPNPVQRAAYRRTGLSLAGCQAADRAAEVIAQVLASNPSGHEPEQWRELRQLFIAFAIDIPEVRQAAENKNILNHQLVAGLASDWIDGLALEELYRRHGSLLGSASLMPFCALLDSVVVSNMAWALSAIAQVLEARTGQQNPTSVNSLAAMAKYGLPTPTACFVASLGITDRAAAIQLSNMYPADADQGFNAFVRWLATLQLETLAAVAGAEAGHLLSRSAEVNTPPDVIAVLRSGSGTLGDVPLRGARHVASALDRLALLGPGQMVDLRREQSNTFDANAIAVYAGAQRLGYVGREMARVLASLIDAGSTAHATIQASNPTNLMALNANALISVSVTPARKMPQRTQR